MPLLLCIGCYACCCIPRIHAAIVDLNDTRLHELAYPGAEPPRRACVGGVLPSCARVAMCYRQPFLPESSRAPQRLTTEAMVVHNALRRSLLPRMGGGEAVTSIQQWLLLRIMSYTPFDTVDFLLCEIQDNIADGLKAGRQQPYTHIISYLLDRTIVQHLQNPVCHPLADSPTFYKVYNLPSSRDRRRGQRALLAA